jgi:hypothetical protein
VVLAAATFSGASNITLSNRFSYFPVLVSVLHSDYIPPVKKRPHTAKK